MSADNGIYILRTKDKQHRVIHAQAIENIFWDENVGQMVCEPVPKQILRFFDNTPYTYSKHIALNIARNMAKYTSVLEYGISIIEVNKTWKQILTEANGTKIH